MRRSLVFGGLSQRGGPLIEALLAEGRDVFSLSSAVNERERDLEAERELFFGRNALFKHVDELPSTRFEQMFLVDTLRIDPDERSLLAVKIKNTVVQAVEAGVRSAVFLSSVAVYGVRGGRLSEKQPVRPDSDEGRALDEMESVFVRQLLHARKIKAAILRVDPVAKRGEKRLGRVPDDEAMRIASLMVELANADFHGLEVVHFTNDDRFDPASNHKMMQLLGDRFPGS